MINQNGLVLPDFLIGGAARSGTTWLHHTLELHPDLYMARPWPPEPQFFYRNDRYELGIEYYSSTWFANTGEASFLGEKSTAYMESADAANRIKKHLPDVKILFLLREPIDRAYSNYLWTRTNGMETGDFLTALRLEDERLSNLAGNLRYVRPYAYYERGLYADFLQIYIDIFGAKQVLCLRYDDIQRNPKKLITRVHEFLGVEIRPQDATGVGVVNTANGEGDTLPDEARRLLDKRYAEPNERLVSLLGNEFRW